MRYTVARRIRTTGRQTTTVTVTATLTFGYDVGADAGGVDEDGHDDGDLHGDVAPAPCDAVTPVDPTVTQASVAAGDLEAVVGVADDRRDHLHGDPPGPYEPATDGDGDGDVD